MRNDIAGLLSVESRYRQQDKAETIQIFQRITSRICQCTSVVREAARYRRPILVMWGGGTIKKQAEAWRSVRGVYSTFPGGEVRIPSYCGLWPCGKCRRITGIGNAWVRATLYRK